jgi:hypothetical protein
MKRTLVLAQLAVAGMAAAFASGCNKTTEPAAADNGVARLSGTCVSHDCAGKSCCKGQDTEGKSSCKGQGTCVVTAEALKARGCETVVDFQKDLGGDLSKCPAM